jgi:hypothetical protein
MVGLWRFNNMAKTSAWRFAKADFATALALSAATPSTSALSNAISAPAASQSAIQTELIASGPPDPIQPEG